MTEELSQDKIDLVNFTDKKITVKHYLNLYIRPVVDNDETEKDPTLWRHTVYVRITFNRLTAKIKSATNLWCTVNELNTLSKDIQKLLDRESMFLMDHISRAYLSFVRQNRSQTTMEEFDINKLLEGFKYEDYELDNIVNKLLNQSMITYLTQEFPNEDTSLLKEAIHGTYNISPLELFTYYSKTIPSLSQFKEKYADEIWTWKVLYINFKNTNSEYNRLGASILDFTHGDFKKAFIESNPTHNSLYIKIIDNIQALLEEHFHPVSFNFI
ncbi:hypothetical protein [Runella aurantiaca]|uniref:Uncharacterized protein n=1 Tax=Runella aurantiaca TaxID=2282308 RepID=A0A369I6I2_9BACT|nr:hypothetical protein [Runella aurantiaca]RDB03845.1 hypothetical protein DVG78_21575 [Runella aurantiaca]